MGILITQCKFGDHLLSWDDQAGKHQPLAVESGRFRHSQLRWHTVDQEGFAIGEKLHPYRHWINGGEHRAMIWTDHKNLLVFFDHRARPPSYTRANYRRMDRWGLNLLTYRYVIRHIDGKFNYFADLTSRWGNQFAEMKIKNDVRKLANATTTKLPRRSTKQLLTALGGMHRRIQSAITTSYKRALKQPYPKVDQVIKLPDRNVDPNLLKSAIKEWVTMESIQARTASLC